MAQYDNLKDYFYGEYGTELKSAISSQILAGGSHKNISDLSIISLKCDEDIASNVTITLGIAANVVDDIESSISDKQFFIVTMKGNLDIQFQDIRIIEIRSAEHDELPEDNILSHFILPDIPLEQVERIGNELYVYYKKHAKFTEPSLSLEKIIDNMCAPIFFSDLTGDCLGRVNFVNSDEKIYHYDTKEKILKYDNHSAEPGTILINKKRYYDELNGEVIITVAHELIHWQLHQKFFKFLVILGTTTDAMNCSATISIPDDNMTDVQKALCIAEWQANTLAMRLAIPQSTVESTIKKIASDPSTYRDNAGDHMQACVIEFAKIYNVSPLVAKERLRQLGCDYVDGTCLEYEENGKKIQAAPFCFLPGSLEDDETFIIYRDEYEGLLHENVGFSELINSGGYIYLGYAVCILDSKYVDNKNGLTDYAREHADECLIKFRYKKITNTGLIYSDHISSYLSKIPEFNKVEIEGFKICGVNKELDEKINDDIEKYVDTINELKSRKCSTFANTLVLHMRKNSIDDSILSHRTTIDLPLIRDYYNGEKIPSEENVMALCIGLKLHPDFCYDMFEKANYFIKADTPKHLAYRFLFKYTSKSIDTCNAILEKLGQKPVPKKNKKRVLNS